MSLRLFFHRVAALLRRRDYERDLNDEVTAHLELAERDGIARGLSPDQARRQARLQFGGIDLMRERHRDRRGLPVVEELGRDLRFSFRSLRRDSGFTFAVCFVMALAIGAGTAIFSVVDAVVLRGLPYDEHDRIAALRTVDSQNATIFGGRSTIQTFLDWQRLQRSFEQIALVDTFFFQIRNERDEPARTPAAQVHADVFRVLRVQPFLGRLLTAEDHRPGQARVALLSHRFWVQRFGADPNAIGQTLELDGAPWRVVGVLPPFFAYPPAAEQPTDLYVPHELRAQDRIRGGSRNYNGIVIGRLKPGVTYASAQAEMNTIAEALERDYPKWEPGRRVNVVPLHQQLVGEARSWMWLLLGAVTLLLVIACANVANLMLVRAAARSREMALRTALGAARGRIVRALLVESVTLSLVAGVVGLGIAYGGIQVLLAWLPDGLPRVAEVAMNVRVLGVALGVATVTGVIFGLVPGLPRAESFLVHALRDGDRATTMSRAGRRLRSALVIAEVAVAVVLVAGAGLFVVSFAKVIGIEPGFDYRNIVVMDLVFSRNPEIDADVDSWMRRGQAQVTEAIEALSHVPAVANVAGVSGGMPLSSGYSRVSLILPERGEIMGNSPDAIDFRRVTPNYFTLLSIPVLRGRAFTPEDDANAPQVAIVNESAATRYWPGQDAIGQRLVIQDKERTIVGIVRDIRQYGPEQSARQGAFVPLAQEPTNGSQLLIKVAGDVNQIVPTLKSVIWSFNRNQFLPPRTTTMEGLMEGLIAERRFNMAVLAILGALALTMAAAGIFSVIACVVSQRQHEIGVRMALGSAPGTIVTMIFKQVAALLTVGFVAGCAGAWYLMSFAEAFLFQVSAADVRVLASALALLAFVGIVAAVIPARRAAGIDPLQVLRE